MNRKLNGFFKLTGLLLLFVLPFGASARGVAESLSGMQPVLDRIYSEMLPMCSKLIDVGRGLAGFGAMWYIASRVYRHQASAEPVDVYPLLRPFALGMCILLFPAVMAVMNGVLQPTVSATGAMVTGSNEVIAKLLKAKEEAMKKSKYYQMYVGEDGRGDRDLWYRYSHPKDPDGSGETFLDGLGNDLSFYMERQSYAFRNNVKQWMKEVLEVVYAAASLCINTLRTFFLIILAVLGPLVLGFAVFDGFQHTLTVYLARYINIFLWLPVANIFGSILNKIQEQMIKLDISQIDANGDTFFTGADTCYLIFLIIGIVGYFSVPTVANYIVNAGGGNAMLQKVNMIVAGSGSRAMAYGGAGMGMAADAMGDAYRRMNGSMAQSGGNDYFPDKDGGNAHQKDRISGS
ncbi:MAG: conjugative transposon protein TraJ [Pedobacter agri]